MYISPYCRLVLVPPNFMKFRTRGQLTDVITCVKFLVDRFRVYGVLTPPKLLFPIDLLRRPYNSVRTAVRHCDLLIGSDHFGAQPLRSRADSIVTIKHCIELCYSVSHTSTVTITMTLNRDMTVTQTKERNWK